jgi:hypothetical protein
VRYPTQQTAKPRQDGYGGLQSRQLGTRQRRIGRDVETNQRCYVSRVLEAPTCCAVPDGPPVAGPQADRDPVPRALSSRQNRFLDGDSVVGRLQENADRRQSEFAFGDSSSGRDGSKADLSGHNSAATCFAECLPAAWQ